jgi:hypothetical protein
MTNRQVRLKYLTQTPFSLKYRIYASRIQSNDTLKAISMPCASGKNVARPSSSITPGKETPAMPLCEAPLQLEWT